MHGTPSTGTVRINRVGFPQCLKNVKAWAKTQARGGVRWVRESEVLALQWVDNKPVSVLTTIDSANDSVVAKRRLIADLRLRFIYRPEFQLLESLIFRFYDFSSFSLSTSVFA